eukprot:g54982.t1
MSVYIAFPRGSVDLSFPQVFMVDQDGPSSSGGGRRRIDIEQLLNSEAEGGKVPWTQQDDFGRSMAAAPILSDMDNGRTRLEMDTEAPTERSAGLKRNRQDLDEKHCGGRKQPTMPDPQRGDKPAARLTMEKKPNGFLKLTREKRGGSAMQQQSKCVAGSGGRKRRLLSPDSEGEKIEWDEFSDDESESIKEAHCADSSRRRANPYPEWTSKLRARNAPQSPKNGGSISVFVSVPGSRIISLCMDPSDSIGVLQKAIEEKEAIPVDKQFLVFNGRPLEEGTLIKYEVGNDSVIQLYPYLPGGGSDIAEQETKSKRADSATLEDGGCSMQDSESTFGPKRRFSISSNPNSPGEIVEFDDLPADESVEESHPTDSKGHVSPQNAGSGGRKRRFSSSSNPNSPAEIVEFDDWPADESLEESHPADSHGHASPQNGGCREAEVESRASRKRKERSSRDEQPRAAGDLQASGTEVVRSSPALPDILRERLKLPADSKVQPHIKLQGKDVDMALFGEAHSKEHGAEIEIKGTDVLLLSCRNPHCFTRGQQKKVCSLEQDLVDQMNRAISQYSRAEAYRSPDQQQRNRGAGGGGGGRVGTTGGGTAVTAGGAGGGGRETTGGAPPYASRVPKRMRKENANAADPPPARLGEEDGASSADSVQLEDPTEEPLETEQYHKRLLQPQAVVDLGPSSKCKFENLACKVGEILTPDTGDLDWSQHGQDEREGTRLYRHGGVQSDGLSLVVYANQDDFGDLIFDRYIEECKSFSRDLIILEAKKKGLDNINIMIDRRGGRTEHGNKEENPFRQELRVSNVPNRSKNDDDIFRQVLRAIQPKLKKRKIYFASSCWAQDCAGTLIPQKFLECLQKAAGFRILPAPTGDLACFPENFPDSTQKDPENEHDVGLGRTLYELNSKRFNSGRSCFSFMMWWRGHKYRCKVYAKDTQMLESRKVRERFGHHLMDMIFSKNFRVNSALRDPKIRNGGFLRFEVTVYGPDEPRYEDMPQYQDIDDLLSELIDRFSPAILCRTSIPQKLENYAENMRKQSKGPVFFYDSGRKTLDVIWSHNKLTKKVAGFHCQYDSYKTPKRLLRQIQLTSTNHTPILLVIATYCLLDKANEKILDFSLKDALQDLQGGLPPTKEALEKRPPQAKIAKLRADQRYVRGLKLYICSYSKEDCVRTLLSFNGCTGLCHTLLKRVKREAEIRGSGKDIEISDEWLRPQSDSPVLDPIVFTDRQKKDELCPERWEVSLCQESRFLCKSLDDCAKKIRNSTVDWLKSKDEFFLPPRDRRPSRDMLLLQPGGYEACKFRESLFAEKRLAFINVRSAGTLSTVNGLFRLPLDLAHLIRECSNRRFRVMAEGHQHFWTPELNLDTAVWSSLTLRVYGSYHPECRSPLKKTKCAIAGQATRENAIAALASQEKLVRWYCPRAPQNSKGGKRQNVVMLVQGFPDKPFQGGHEIAAQLAKAEQEYSRGFCATIRMEIKQSRKTGTRSRRVVVRDYELHIRIEPHEAAEGSAILESDGQHENISQPHSSSSSASGQRVCCSWALGAARSSLLFVPLLLCFHQFVKSLLLDELDKFATGDTMSYLLRVVAQGVAQGLDSNRKTTVEAVETIDCTDMEGLCNESKGVGWRTKSGQNISDQISRSKPGSTIFLSALSDGYGGGVLQETGRSFDDGTHWATMILFPKKAGPPVLLVVNTLKESDPASKRVVEAAERVKSNLTAKLNLGRSEITMQVLHTCFQREGWACAYQSAAAAGYLLYLFLHGDLEDRMLASKALRPTQESTLSKVQKSTLRRALLSGVRLFRLRLNHSDGCAAIVACGQFSCELREGSAAYDCVSPSPTPTQSVTPTPSPLAGALQCAQQLCPWANCVNAYGAAACPCYDSAFPAAGGGSGCARDYVLPSLVWGTQWLLHAQIGSGAASGGTDPTRGPYVRLYSGYPADPVAVRHTLSRAVTLEQWHVYGLRLWGLKVAGTWDTGVLRVSVALGNDPAQIVWDWTAVGLTDTTGLQERSLPDFLAPVAIVFDRLVLEFRAATSYSSEVRLFALELDHVNSCHNVTDCGQFSCELRDGSSAARSSCARGPTASMPTAQLRALAMTRRFPPLVAVVAARDYVLPSLVWGTQWLLHAQIGSGAASGGTDPTRGPYVRLYSGYPADPVAVRHTLSRAVTLEQWHVYGLRLWGLKVAGTWDTGVLRVSVALGNDPAQIVWDWTSVGLTDTTGLQERSLPDFLAPVAIVFDRLLLEFRAATSYSSEVRLFALELNHVNSCHDVVTCGDFVCLVNAASATYDCVSPSPSPTASITPTPSPLAGALQCAQQLCPWANCVNANGAAACACWDSAFPVGGGSSGCARDYVLPTLVWGTQWALLSAVATGTASGGTDATRGPYLRLYSGYPADPVAVRHTLSRAVTLQQWHVYGLRLWGLKVAGTWDTGVLRVSVALGNDPAQIVWDWTAVGLTDTTGLQERSLPDFLAPVAIVFDRLVLDFRAATGYGSDVKLFALELNHTNACDDYTDCGQYSCTVRSNSAYDCASPSRTPSASVTPSPSPATLAVRCSQKLCPWADCVNANGSAACGCWDSAFPAAGGSSGCARDLTLPELVLGTEWAQSEAVVGTATAVTDATYGRGVQFYAPTTADDYVILVRTLAAPVVLRQFDAYPLQVEGTKSYDNRGLGYTGSLEVAVRLGSGAPTVLAPATALTSLSTTNAALATQYLGTYVTTGADVVFDRLQLKFMGRSAAAASGVRLFRLRLNHSDGCAAIVACGQFSCEVHDGSGAYDCVSLSPSPTPSITPTISVTRSPSPTSTPLTTGAEQCAQDLCPWAECVNTYGLAACPCWAASFPPGSGTGCAQDFVQTEFTYSSNSGSPAWTLSSSYYGSAQGYTDATYGKYVALQVQRSTYHVQIVRTFSREVLLKQWHVYSLRLKGRVYSAANYGGLVELSIALNGVQQQVLLPATDVDNYFSKTVVQTAVLPSFTSGTDVRFNQLLVRFTAAYSFVTTAADLFGLELRHENACPTPLTCGGGQWVCEIGANAMYNCVSPTPTRSPSATVSLTATVSVTPSLTPTSSPSATASVSPSPSATVSDSPSGSVSATPTPTPPNSPLVTPTSSRSWSASSSATPSLSVSASVTSSLSVSASVTPSVTATRSPDIDECTTTTLCQWGDCTNTYGSYVCSCWPTSFPTQADSGCLPNLVLSNVPSGYWQLLSTAGGGFAQSLQGPLGGSAVRWDCPAATDSATVAHTFTRALVLQQARTYVLRLGVQRFYYYTAGGTLALLVRNSSSGTTLTLGSAYQSSSLSQSVKTVLAWPNYTPAADFGFDQLLLQLTGAGGLYVYDVQLNDTSACTGVTACAASGLVCQLNGANGYNCIAPSVTPSPTASISTTASVSATRSPDIDECTTTTLCQWGDCTNTAGRAAAATSSGTTAPTLASGANWLMSGSAPASSLSDANGVGVQCTGYNTGDTVTIGRTLGSTVVLKQGQTYTMRLGLAIASGFASVGTLRLSVKNTTTAATLTLSTQTPGVSGKQWVSFGSYTPSADFAFNQLLIQHWGSPNGANLYNVELNNTGACNNVAACAASGLWCQLDGVGGYVCVSPSPSLSLTPSGSITPSNSVTSSISVSASISVTVSISATVSDSVTPTISLSSSPTPTNSLSSSPTPTNSLSSSPTPTISPSVTPTLSPTPTISLPARSSATDNSATTYWTSGAGGTYGTTKVGNVCTNTATSPISVAGGTNYLGEYVQVTQSLGSYAKLLSVGVVCTALPTQALSMAALAFVAGPAPCRSWQC